MDKYDVIIIGSGPGGYVSAIKFAQLGFTVALVEKYLSLGGTCLNVGCIPSKALLDSSEHYYNAVHNFKDHGIVSEKMSFDFSKMLQRKTDIITQVSGGVKYLMDKNKITVLQGLASFKTKNEISIDNGTQRTVIFGDNIIIATGSKPSVLPSINIDKERIITSTEALSLKQVPKTLSIIGGGVIGLELGSVYARLGTKVTVVEYFDRIVPNMDTELSKELTKILKKEGILFHFGCNVTSVESKKGKVTIQATEIKGGKEVFLESEYCLVAVGRTPNTKDLCLENIGISTDKRGFVEVNASLQTSIDNIYAIGDVIGGKMLAHKAEEEGIFVAETLAGQKPHLNYNLIPEVVYTWPEVASVGKTEQQLKDSNIKYSKGKFPFKALGRAKASNDVDGFVKVLTDSATDEILGVHMIGPRVADMISEAVIAMEYKASAEDIARICHAHPTYTEAFKEAAYGTSFGKYLHI